MTSICEAAEVDSACARLSAAQADEVGARVKLLLRSRSDAPRSILVACDHSRAWVVWNGPPAEILDVSSEGTLVEALLDAIEQRVERAPAEPAPAPAAKPRPLPTSPHEAPTWGERAPLIEAPKPLVESGGIGIGLLGELLGDGLGPALGPRLDIGVGWGPWSLQLSESARFARSDAGSSAFLYDLGGGLGWGAPFSRAHPIGAALLGGGEWFHIEGHTVTTGFASLGLRGALALGALSLALGVDGRLRFAPQHVGERVDVQVPRWSGLVFVEGVLLVEPARSRPR